MALARASAGFTLVETLVALAILSSVLVATYAALSNALATAARLAERDTALQAVARQVASLRTTPASLLRTLHGETASFRWQVSVALIPRSVVAPHGIVIPYRLIGVIIPKSGSGSAEVVLDTIIVGRGA